MGTDKVSCCWCAATELMRRLKLSALRPLGLCRTWDALANSPVAKCVATDVNKKHLRDCLKSACEAPLRKQTRREKSHLLDVLPATWQIVKTQTKHQASSPCPRPKAPQHIASTAGFHLWIARDSQTCIAGSQPLGLCRDHLCRQASGSPQPWGPFHQGGGSAEMEEELSGMNEYTPKSAMLQDLASAQGTGSIASARVLRDAWQQRAMLARTPSCTAIPLPGVDAGLLSSPTHDSQGSQAQLNKQEWAQQNAAQTKGGHRGQPCSKPRQGLQCKEEQRVLSVAITTTTGNRD